MICLIPAPSDYRVIVCQECVKLATWLTTLQGLGRREISSGIAPTEKNVHFICHGTRLVKGKFSLFIVDNYSDTK